MVCAARFPKPLPYLWPLRLARLPAKRNLCRTTDDGLVDNIEKVASPKKHAQNRYPIYDQTGWKPVPFGAVHTHIRNYPLSYSWAWGYDFIDNIFRTSAARVKYCSHHSKIKVISKISLGSLFDILNLLPCLEWLKMFTLSINVGSKYTETRQREPKDAGPD